MAGFNGDGTYSRVHNWVSDKTNGIKITASRMDAEFDTMAQAFENCLTRDGQGFAQDNLPMNNYRHTGVGAATARDQYLRIAEAQDGKVTYLGTATYTLASGYEANSDVPFSSYVAGQKFELLINTTNSATSATLNVNSLGAKALVGRDGRATGRGTFFIPSGGSAFVSVLYDGNAFRVMSPQAWEEPVFRGRLVINQSASNQRMAPYTITEATSSATRYRFQLSSTAAAQEMSTFFVEMNAVFPSGFPTLAVQPVDFFASPTQGPNSTPGFSFEFIAASGTTTTAPGATQVYVTGWYLR